LRKYSSASTSERQRMQKCFPVCSLSLRGGGSSCIDSGLIGHDVDMIDADGDHDVPAVSGGLVSHQEAIGRGEPARQYARAVSRGVFGQAAAQRLDAFEGKVSLLRRKRNLILIAEMRRPF